MDYLNKILVGDVREKLLELPAESVHCCVTSPPYWGLRDYGVDGQLGLEATPQEYVEKMVGVFREVRRVLRSDGTLWLNIGDSYAGSGRGMNGDGTAGKCGEKQTTNAGAVLDMHDRRVQAGAIGRDWIAPPPGLKCKDLVGIPWRLAFALQADGWWIRSDIIWAKPNPMPESVTDRPTKAHEYLFLLARSERYYYDMMAIREDAEYTPDRPTTGWDMTSGTDHKQKRGRYRNPAPKGSFNGKTSIEAPREEAFRAVVLKRNKRSVWTIATQPYEEAHFATFPEAIVEPCILAGSPADGVVLDPFMGSGTTALVALKAGRKFVGVELNPKYAAMAERRIAPELNQLRLV